MAVLVRSLIVASLCLNLSCSQQETFVSFRTKGPSEYSDNYKQEEDATPIKADKNSTEENELDGNKLNPDSESDDQALYVTPRSLTEASKDYKDHIHFLKDAPSKNGPLLRFNKCKFRPWSTRIKEHTARIISSYPGIKGFGKNDIEILLIDNWNCLGKGVAAGFAFHNSVDLKSTVSLTINSTLYIQYLENDLSAEEAFSTDEARHQYFQFYLTVLHEISHAMDFKFFEVVPLFEKILVDTNQHGYQFYKVTQEENNLLRHKFIDIHWDRMADDEILELAPKYPKELNYDTWIDKAFNPKKTAFVSNYAPTNIMENFAELTSLYFMLTRVISTGFPQDMRYKQLVDNVCSSIDLLYEQGYKIKEDCRACFKGACHFTDHPFTKSDIFESEIPVGTSKNFNLTRKLRSDVIFD